MYPFDSKRGLLALGLALASGGGTVITKLMQADPKQQQMYQAILVFWLIFVFKTTRAYIRKLEGAAAPGRQQQRSAAAAPAAAAAKAAAVAAADDSDDEDEPRGGAARRRRTRRD